MVGRGRALLGGRRDFLISVFHKITTQCKIEKNHTTKQKERRKLQVSFGDEEKPDFASLLNE
jgi:hypothetical protein